MRLVLGLLVLRQQTNIWPAGDLLLWLVVASAGV
jgi:hypothetical protein